jgi:hypothetical protein
MENDMQSFNVTARNSMKAPKANGAVVYTLAKEGPFELRPFGPLMALNVAQHYQAELQKGGFDVLVVNMSAY